MLLVIRKLLIEHRVVLERDPHLHEKRHQSLAYETRIVLVGHLLVYSAFDLDEWNEPSYRS